MSRPTDAVEYPPLFVVGRHTMSLDDLKTYCVDQFPLSTRRQLLFEALKAFAHNMASLGVACELWIDGSFVTQKLDPGDVDIVACYDGIAIDSLSETVWFTYQEQFERLRANFSEACHVFMLVRQPKNHDEYWESEYNYSYWMRQWGFSRNDVPKGMAVIEIGGAECQTDS